MKAKQDVVPQEYCAGFNAWVMRVPITSNPFTKGYKYSDGRCPYDDWNQGWNDAKSNGLMR